MKNSGEREKEGGRQTISKMSLTRMKKKQQHNRHLPLKVERKLIKKREKKERYQMKGNFNG